MSKNIKLNGSNGFNYLVSCNVCSVKTNHYVLNSVGVSWDDGVCGSGHDEYEIIKCAGCDNISFRIGSTNDEDYYELNDEFGDPVDRIFPERERVYPKRLPIRKFIKGADCLPAKVLVMYRETYIALAAELKLLVGIGIRALVEAVCLEEQSTRGDLKMKIDDLVVKNVLTKGNADILHKTRFLGNSAAHEIEPPSDAEIDVAFDIVENLLETVYIVPTKAELLKSK